MVLNQTPQLAASHQYSLSARYGRLIEAAIYSMEENGDPEFNLRIHVLTPGVIEEMNPCIIWMTPAFFNSLSGRVKSSFATAEIR